jgi:cytochrome c-type biogenesis protein
METMAATKSYTTFNRLQIFLHALVFVLGFSLVFIVGWGGTATVLGQLFGQYKTVIGQIGGVVVIMFGLATLDVIRLPWFYYSDTRPSLSNKTGSFAGSGVMGIFFAAGWSPCIGTTLGAILTLGFSQETVGQAMWLSSAYSIGLGLPFLILAIGLNQAVGWVRKLSRYIRTFKIVSGVLIIIIGILLLTNWMTLISIWAFKNNLFIDVFSISTGIPSYLTALAAGLLSFFSPCVLPLVPAYLGYLSGYALNSVKT